MNIIEFDSVLKYIQHMKILYPVVEGRITLLNLKKSENFVPAGAPHSTLSVSIVFFAAIVQFLI